MSKNTVPDWSIADHLRRGDPNYAAYPPEARPILERSFAHWNALWETILAEGDKNSLEMEQVAGLAASSAWRIYLGECVRTVDLVRGEDDPPITEEVLALFPSSPTDRRWWFTEEGWRIAQEKIRDGKMVP